VFGQHHRPKPRNAAGRANGESNVVVHEGAMQGNHGAPFGLMAASHYAVGVVFKLLNIMPSLGHRSNHHPSRGLSLSFAT
jgi:hypothetical protein